MDDKPDSGGFALEDARARTLNIRSLIAFAFIALCMLITVAAVWVIPVALDSRHQTQTEDQFEQTLAAELEAIGKLSLEYSYWNEAVEKIIQKQDIAWADSALGSYLNNSYGITRILAENQKGERQYTYAAGESSDKDFWQKARPDLQAITDVPLAADTSSPEPTHSYAMVDGALYLIGISPFVAYEPTELDTSDVHGILFLARPVDTDTLSTWSQRYKLTDLSLAPGKAPEAEPAESTSTVVVHNAAGAPIAHLAWQPMQLGRKMLGQAMPWGMSVGLVFLIATAVLIMNLEKLVGFARSNITELDRQKQKLYRQAMFDEVSNLHNRNYLISRLEEELARIRRSGTSALFIFLDLDGFKMVNDTMGHSAGDDLLRQVGGRLVDALRSEDLVCRFGGDEFCILITGLEGHRPDAAREVAEKISGQVISELERPFTVDDKPVNIGASAGIVVIPDDTSNIEDILRFGDLAMYKAKLVSGNKFIHYDRDFLHDINYRNAIRHKLEFAMPKTEFGLIYQSIHDMRTGQIVGFEALARWESEELGLIRPSHFIAIAEESDTIVRLGRWVIDEALRDARPLREAAGGRCFISINISGKQLTDPQFCSYLDERMDLYGVSPNDVYLEVTESYEVCRGESGLDMLQEIRSRGIHLSLDDFGTGYASLSYLQQYPLSCVKIDQDFVCNMMGDSKVEGIIRALVQMGDSLEIRIIAEGVETEAQEQALVELGCHWAQGYYYSTPESITSLTQSAPAPHKDA